MLGYMLVLFVFDLGLVWLLCLFFICVRFGFGLGSVRVLCWVHLVSVRALVCFYLGFICH